MYRKIIYIAICSLVFTNINAQQQKVLQLADQIRMDIGPILDDSLIADPCKKNIDSLKLQLPPKNATTISTKKIQLLINTSIRFIAFQETVDDSTCQDKKIDSLALTVKEFVKALNIIKTTLPARTDTLAKVTIIIIDSATKKSVTGKLKIDSSGKPVTRFSQRKDSTNYFDALLVLNRQYRISVKADNYFPSLMDYRANKNGNMLIIGLRNSDTGKVIISPSIDTVKIIQPVVKPVIPAPLPKNPVSWYLYGAILLFILLFFIAILYFNVLAKSMRKAKGFRSIMNPASVFQQEINEKDSFIKEINTNLEVAETSLAQATEHLQSMELEQKKTNLVKKKGTAGRFFLCEIMMTAGPRKKFMNQPNSDKDLGEDVCGFISTTNEVLIWLLDGTSDVHCLINPESNREYFSSRLQAQSIAKKLRKHFVETPTAPLNEFINQAVQSVRLDWLEAINKLPETEKKLLKTNITNQNLPECSSTLLLCRLSINGDFTGYRSGDSKMLLFRTKSVNEMNFVESTLAEKNPLSNDRMFFRLQFDDNENFDILYNEPMFEIITEKDISLVIAFSDGIGWVTEEALKEGFKHAPDEIRQEIITQTQGTADDKSICFLEIKQP